MIRPALLSLALLIAPQAHALTPVEAAAQNMQLAMTICFQSYQDHDSIHGKLLNAGFVHEPETWSAGEVFNWYIAPARTATVLVLGQNGETECRVTTDLFGVAEALPFARAVIDQLYTDEIVDGSPEGQNIRPGSPEAQDEFCSGFHLYAPRRLIWIALARAGNDGTCISDGTASILMRM